MKITDLFAKRTVISFEVFPPKTDRGMENLVRKGGVLDQLYEFHPDYISCTYGSSGTRVGKNLEVVSKIREDGRAIPVTHLTCIGNTRESVAAQLQTYLDHGVDHVLALRGDLPAGWKGTGGDFHYATDLVRFIRERFGDRFTIAVAGSPEGHIQCRSLEADIAFLRQKQDLGADYIMTQLCWDMEQFKRWLDAIREAGVTMPVDVGIMPVMDEAQTINMALSRNGCVMERKLSAMISRNWIFPNPFAPTEPEKVVAAKKAAFREEGMAYTISQIDTFLSLGVSGIHLYTLNKAGAVTELVRAAGVAGTA